MCWEVYSLLHCRPSRLYSPLPKFFSFFPFFSPYFVTFFSIFFFLNFFIRFSFSFIPAFLCLSFDLFPAHSFRKNRAKIFSDLSTRISKTLRVLTCPIGRTRKATVKNERISSIQKSRELSIGYFSFLFFLFFQKLIESVRLNHNTNSRIVSCYFVPFYFIEI